jgi:DNA-binding FadR family transcriptional regulator
LITREIVEGRLKPGDRLPTEHRLSTSLGVSRNVVREAIARLRADGIVESRQGVGAFVIRPERRSTLRVEAASLEDVESIRSLFELRAILEIEAAALAAARATDEQLARIGASLEAMRGAQKWGEGGVDADLAFHREVAGATNNTYIATFVTFLAEQMRETIIATRGDHNLQSVVEITIAEHAAILDAIGSRDQRQARAAMAEHINGAASRLTIALAAD